MAHQCYAGSPRDDDYTRLATLAPTDARVFQSHYANLWDELSPYEKCVFWWTEVHLYAEELRDRFPAVPMLSIKAEDMLGGELSTLRALTNFIGVPFEEALIRSTEDRVDRWHHRTDIDFDASTVTWHAATVQVARRMGYDVMALDTAALEARYRGTPSQG